MEEFKDPQWQKKRLKIFERDSFICRRCQKKDRTLHIHHLFYLDKFRERAPWEYPDWALTTLCEMCHEKVTIKDGKYRLCILGYSLGGIPVAVCFYR